MTQTIEIFICYAPEDQSYLQILKTHLAALKRQYQISICDNGSISPGEDRIKTIYTHLNNAQIILLLISPNFIESSFCFDRQLKWALECAKKRQAQVIPLLIRSTLWEGMPFSKLQVLPSNKQFVTLWTNEGEGFLDITRGIEKVIKELGIQSSTKEIRVALANGDLPFAKIKIADLREKAPQDKRLHDLERIFYSVKGKELQLLIDKGKFSLVGEELNQLPDYTSEQATSGSLKEHLYLVVYQKAQHLIEKNDFPQAQELLAQLLFYYKDQKDVLSPWKGHLYLALYQKAQHLIEKNDFPQAQKILEQFSIYYREQEDVLRPCKEYLHSEMYEKAQRLVEKKNFLQAKDILRLVGRNQPDYVDTEKLLKKIGVHKIKAKAYKLEPSLFFLFITLDSTIRLFIQSLPWLFAVIVLITIICYLFSAQCYEKKSLLFSIGTASIAGLILTLGLFYLLYSKEPTILLNKNQILYGAICTIIFLVFLFVSTCDGGCFILVLLLQIFSIWIIWQSTPNLEWLYIVIGIFIVIGNLIGITIWFKCCVAAWDAQDGKASHMLPYVTYESCRDN